MIDEKKINQAAIECADEYYSVGLGMNRTEIIMEIFARGVQWALQEFKKSLWHDAQEMPEEGKPFVFAQEFSGLESYHIGTMLRPRDYAKNRDFWHMSRWCYLSDLLPRKVGEQ